MNSPDHIFSAWDMAFPLVANSCILGFMVKVAFGSAEVWRDWVVTPNVPGGAGVVGTAAEALRAGVRA